MGDGGSRLSGQRRQSTDITGSATQAAWKKHQGRTSFTHQQHQELEALFSQTMFPAKNLLKELAARLNLQEKTVKVWFRNRRFKLRKQHKQEEQPQKQSNLIPPPKKNMPSSLAISTKPSYFSSVVLDFNSSLSCHPTSPSDSSEDFAFTESPTIDFQMQDLQLERLVASVPALCPDAYDINQIIELYSFPDECEVSSCSFSCLYQYLSPARSQLEGEGVSLCTFCGPAAGPSPGQTCIPSMTSRGSAAWSLSLASQNLSKLWALLQRMHWQPPPCDLLAHRQGTQLQQMLTQPVPLRPVTTDGHLLLIFQAMSYSALGTI
ncbi:arginine-fifty homeobox [Erethizon dorsatum]